MSVSSELLCSFELLKPLDSNALKSHIKKSRNKRNQLLNSPVSISLTLILYETRLIARSPPVSIPKASEPGGVRLRRRRYTIRAGRNQV